MKIAYTRAMVRAALDGRLMKVPMRRDERFGLSGPESCPDVPTDILDPRSTWSDKASYDAIAADLCKRFTENFKQFEIHVSDAVLAARIGAAG